MNCRIFPVLSLIALSSVVQAQTEIPAEVEPLPVYDVEVVLFKNLQGPRGLEYVRPTSLPGKADSIIEIQSTEAVDEAADLGFSMLDDAELRLLDQATKLSESPRYELLLHTAWRQPGLDFEQSIPVWLRGGNRFGSEYSSIDFRPDSEAKASQIADSINNAEAADSIDADDLAAEQRALDSILQPVTNTDVVITEVNNNGLHELEGRITVSLSRYLHVDADLVLRKPRPLGQTQAGFYYSQGNSQSESRILENHRLQERRRMRSSTLHYLDHPHFSMLVIITPYEAEAEETLSDDGASGATTTALGE